MTVLKVFELMRILKVFIFLMHKFLFDIVPALCMSHKEKFTVHSDDFFIFYDVIDYIISSKNRVFINETYGKLK